MKMNKYEVDDDIYFLRESKNHPGKIEIEKGKIEKLIITKYSPHNFYVSYDVKTSLGNHGRMTFEEQYINKNIGDLINNILESVDRNIRKKLSK